MGQEQQHYIKCDACGTSVLEQCAIEEDGQLLCGDCIVNETKKEVVEVEETTKKRRQQEYDVERKKIIARQKKKSILILVIVLIIFGLTQIIMTLNQTAPVESVAIDYVQDLNSAKALITIGLYRFAAEQNKLPASLKELSPKYVPQGVDMSFSYFYYKKESNDVYELELLNTTSIKSK